MATVDDPVGGSERVIICGSRGFADLQLVRLYVERLAPDAVVIVGGARGPDRVAESVARARGLTVELFRPDWKRYGKAAGMRRNAQMLDAHPTSVVAFFDGASAGTSMMIDQAKHRRIDLTVVRTRGTLTRHEWRSRPASGGAGQGQLFTVGEGAAAPAPAHAERPGGSV